MGSKTDVRNDQGANNDAGVLAVTLFAAQHKILVIGADAAVLATRKYLLLRAGYGVETCSGDHAAMAMLTQEHFDMAVLAPSYPPVGYQQLEDRVLAVHPKALIVKIQRLNRDRGLSPDSFVEGDSPTELLESVSALFDGQAPTDTGVVPLTRRVGC
jgi:hypothetical protein